MRVTIFEMINLREEIIYCLRSLKRVLVFG